MCNFNKIASVNMWLTYKIQFLVLPLIGVGLIIVNFYVNAEFDPEVLSKSTVRILIKNKQRVTSVATGFLWKTNTQIVTSLHIINNDPNSRIIVEFGKIKRKATVKAVLAHADLVLLEINKPVTGWIPLLEFEAIKPKYKATVSALGFNRGSIGMSTRELIKGFVTPEILQVLLPPNVLKSIVRHSTLNIKLPIYYLDGSLLPGYSGSPIVNSQGKLIGIGDGGLENGAASVSWVIPALNLNALLKSTTSKLPESLEAFSQIFSGDKLNVGRKRIAFHPIPAENKLIPLQQSLFSFLLKRAFAQPIVAPEVPPLIEINYNQFNFVKVKSRSYGELLVSSGTPINMDQVFILYNHIFQGYKVDYKKLVFDVYEDGHFGLNIAVPQGVKLIVDNDDFLVAQGNMLCRSCDYGIQYHARKLKHKEQMQIKNSAELFLNTVANKHWDELNEEGDY
ncbi:serine protease, partial [Crocosphaera sp.]|uniref:S1 family peptidase n=1 Tax=Crocosphaera sp. TaxID=2729996 RepID=UPI00257968CD